MADRDFQSLRFDYVHRAEQSAAAPARHPVVVVGAGPVGLALAIDLAQRRMPVVLLDNDDSLSTGSRAICFAKRTLEIFDRLGCGDRMVDKGVSWNVGRVFFRDQQIYSFDLLPEAGHHRPAFINLQQYYVEGYLAERAAQLPLIDLRWKNSVSGVQMDRDGSGDGSGDGDGDGGIAGACNAVTLTIDTPDGSYRLQADHLVACDGSRSALRRLLGLESTGRVFRDRFLIADVRMTHPAPPERWFWFDPAFHPQQSVLLHRQPDGVWRIDFQLGWDADPEVEKQPQRIIPRVKALLAHSAMKDAEFELEWASVYTFACTRMQRFRHGRVLFAGDAAHGVSPFGARGANSGVQDADNLGWKLAEVLTARAPDALLDSYAEEREYAADENLRHSTRSTDFITPKSPISRLFRDSVLELSKTQPFARALVNSGRLSVPATLHASSLNTPDGSAFAGDMLPGAAAADAPLRDARGRTGWLLGELGSGFSLLVGCDGQTPDLAPLRQAAERLDVTIVAVDLGGGRQRWLDAEGLVARRYDLTPGAAYLLRPDQHVCARWRAVTAARLEAALERALGASAKRRPRLTQETAMSLITSANFDAPDDFYEALLAAHGALDEVESHAFNARLVLILANHIGRQDVLIAALRAARVPTDPDRELPPG